ncbi:MAG: hypothetical protein NTV22_04760 [bacterium]|nr:hypothetical protein [bacterium]
MKKSLLFLMIIAVMRVGAQPDTPAAPPASQAVPLFAPVAVMPPPAPSAWQLPFEDDPQWSWKNMGYGPIEIGSGALAPMVGAFIGGVVGVMLPLKGMQPACAMLVPYTAVGGAAAGTVAGAMLAPIVMVEGLCNTVTGGAFSHRPFAWFNVKIPVSEHVQETFGSLTENNAPDGP